VVTGTDTITVTTSSALAFWTSLLSPFTRIETVSPQIPIGVSALLRLPSPRRCSCLQESQGGSPAGRRW
jgi:hypothetical protein